MLVLEDSLLKNITEVIRMVRDTNALFASHTDISDRQIQQLSFRSAEMALLSLAAADEIGTVKEASERMIRGELSYALHQIAIQAINVQAWESPENIREYFGVMAKHSRFVADILQIPEDPAQPDQPALRGLVPAYGAASDLPSSALTVEGIKTEADKLKAEVQALREILTALVLERDDLLQVVCKKLEADYMRELGAVEAEIYRSECQVKYLQRKLELMQAAVNQRKPIRESEIEAALRSQYEEYRRNYRDFIRRVKEASGVPAVNGTRAGAARSPGDSGGEVAESEEKLLKKLYRRIAKALHPDIHPNQDPAERELFQKAIRAYKDGDLKTLTEIAGTLDGEPPGGKEAVLDALLAEKTRLLAIIRSVRADIQAAKSRFPYTKKDILTDPIRLAGEKNELNRRLDRAVRQAAGYANRIREMKRNYGGFDR